MSSKPPINTYIQKFKMFWTYLYCLTVRNNAKIVHVSSFYQNSSKISRKTWKSRIKVFKKILAAILTRVHCSLAFFQIMYSFISCWALERACKIMSCEKKELLYVSVIAAEAAVNCFDARNLGESTKHLYCHGYAVSATISN